MTNALRLAILGAGGRIAADYAAVLEDLDGIDVAALVEPEARARDNLEGRGGAAAKAPTFETLEALTSDGPEFDAALVATPPAYHEALSIELLQRGKAVLCEKPLAPSLDAARRMYDAASAAGLPLAMASKFRFVADVDRARALLDGGAIGTPLLYENVFCARVDMTARWNADPDVSGGGVLIDNGAHAADLAACLGGELRAVTAAAAAPRIQPVPVEDTVRVTLETATGVVGHVDLSWSLNTGRSDYVTVHGTSGSLSLCWDGIQLRHNDGRIESIGDGYDKRRAFAAQLKHFKDACNGTVELRPTQSEALRSVEFIEAAYRAMREGRRVAIGEATA